MKRQLPISNRRVAEDVSFSLSRRIAGKTNLPSTSAVQISSRLTDIERISARVIF
jgi:hypothetical protein